MAWCKRCREGVAHEFAHDARAYGYHRCRCDICCAAMRVKSRAYYESNRAAISASSQARYAANPQPYRDSERERYWRDDRKRDSTARSQVRHSERRSAERREWYQRNKDYALATNRLWKEKARNIPSHIRGAWSDAEDSLILSNPDATITELAYMLGRSYFAVAGRMQRKGYKTSTSRSL